MTRMPISRRRILQGMGAAVGLPFLEAMLPGTARASAAPASPLRLAFLYVPNGMHMPDWTPAQDGSDFELPSSLQPLAKYQSQMNVLSGLTLNGARALGDGGGDHARSVASFLTGAHPKKTDGKDIKNGISVDQLAAAEVGQQTRLPSLELGLERSAPAGRCDSGYSCVYTSNMSWRSETSPVAKEIDPAAVFDRLFGNQKKNETQANRSKREDDKKSILDFVLEDAKQLQRDLGARDQRKLDEYLYAVRQIERQIAAADKLSRREQGVPDYPRPAGVPKEFDEHLRLLFDLMVLAMQADSTRILSCMYTNAGSNRSYPQIGVSAGHHSLSHHGNDKGKQEKISKINRYHVEQFAYLVNKLAETDDGDGSLLDNSLVLYGSGIGDGNRHNHDDLPIVLMGQGGGRVKTGRHRKHSRNTPLTNLYVTLLNEMGVQVDQFSDSNGRVSLS